MLLQFWKVKIYIPLMERAHGLSFQQAVGLVPNHIQRVVEATQSLPLVGRVGNYDNIYEVDFGFEGYRPTDGATPRYGSIGENVLLWKVALITYVRRDCGKEVLLQLVEAVKAVHPWEHPIIEFSDCLLYVPDARI